MQLGSGHATDARPATSTPSPAALCRGEYKPAASQAVSLTLDPTTREPLIAVFDFEDHTVSVRSSVLQYRGGSWQPVGSTAQLPLISYK